VRHEQSPPPLTGEDAASGSARNPAHVAGRDEPSQGRQALGPLLIGIAAKFLVAMAIPIGIVIVLAFLAQHVISSH
jgi:hypothetical protein